ncbi:MAG TPA: YbjQ family protein [Gemmatimonadaceae bacterium]
MPVPPLSDFTTTTSNALEGYDVVQTLGIVRGIVVRSRSFVGNIGVAFQTLRGGNISLLTDLCERARGDAYQSAIEHAIALGANALIAVRYDATEIMSGVSEVLCYGTAVRVAPKMRRTE